MIDRTPHLNARREEYRPSSEDAQAQEQAADTYTLTVAKELLCDLFKQGRITAECRFAGENILAVALHAIENPDLRKLASALGPRLAMAQWVKEQGKQNEPF